MRDGRTIFMRILFGLSLLAVCITGVRTAQAGAVQITSAAGLSGSDATLTFPNTSFGTAFGSPVSYTAGGDTVTFSDVGGVFEIDQAGTNYFSTAFSTGTNILYAGGFQGADAPITMSFAAGVTQVGFTAEESNGGPYAVTFSAFDGATLLGTFTSNGCDPLGSCSSSSGTLSFEGVQATGGSVITSIVISDDNGDNIGLGPVAFGTSSSTTPEPASLFLLGTGLLGLAPFVRRRLAAF